MNIVGGLIKEFNLDIVPINSVRGTGSSVHLEVIVTGDPLAPDDTGPGLIEIDYTKRGPLTPTERILDLSEHKVVFSEFMFASEGGENSLPQWIEVSNNTDEEINLRGACYLIELGNEALSLQLIPTELTTEIERSLFIIKDYFKEEIRDETQVYENLFGLSVSVTTTSLDITYFRLGLNQLSSLIESECCR